MGLGSICLGGAQSQCALGRAVGCTRRAGDQRDRGAGMRPSGRMGSEIPQELIPAVSYVKGHELGCGGCN